MELKESLTEALISDIDLHAPQAALLNTSFEPLSEPVAIMEPVLYRYWAVPFPRQTMLVASDLFSHIRLHITLDRMRSRVWSISQLYADEQGPGSRFVLSLSKLVVSPSGTALISVSFSHIAWVEDPLIFTGTSGSAKQSKTQRVLRLAAFPPRGSATSTPFVPTTLDIPNACLAQVRSIYLEPALASVFILCEGNRLHKFRFA